MVNLLPDALLADLGARIVAGDLPPGRVITLEEIVTTRGVSRTVAREAVKALAQLGMVAVRRRSGTAVTDPSQWDHLAPLMLRWRLAGPDRLVALADISELRRAVEPVAARLAAARATGEEVERLGTAFAGMERCGRPRGDEPADLEAYLAHDIALHTTLLVASRNPLFASLAHVVAEVLTGRTHHHLMPQVPNPDAIDWHGDVVRAIAAGDGQRAEEAMRLIVAEAQEAATALATAQD